MSGTDSTPNLGDLGRNDQIFLGVGLLAFIFSFIDFAHISEGGFTGGDISAWHGVGALAALLLLVSILTWAVVAFAPSMLEQLPISGRVAAVGLSVLALLFFIIRWLTLPGGSVLGHHYGFSLAWGGYVTLILVIVQIVYGYIAIRASGDALPWEHHASPAAPPMAPPPSAEPPVVQPPAAEPPISDPPTG